MSDHLLNSVNDVKILPGLHSDHSLLYLDLVSGNIDNRGRGYWKFNSSLLHDTEYITIIKKVIADGKQKYAYLQNKGLKWDIIKMDIRSATIPYCINKKIIKKAREKELNERYTDLYNNINNENTEQTILEEFYTVKN